MTIKEYQELRVYDDEIPRPDEENLACARKFVEHGHSVSYVKKVFNIYRTSDPRY